MANGVVRPEHGLFLLEDVIDVAAMLIGMRRGADPVKWVEVTAAGEPTRAVASPVAALM